MPKTKGGIAAAVLVAMSLTGCAAATEAAPPTPAGTTEAPEASPTPAALVAEEPQASSEETAVVEFVRSKLLPDTQIPNATDEQIIEAVQEACARLEAGESGELMSVIEGEQVNSAGYYYDSSVIIAAGRASICPA